MRSHEILFIHMPRGGSHAVVNWIRGHFNSEDLIFLDKLDHAIVRKDCFVKKASNKSVIYRMQDNFFKSGPYLNDEFLDKQYDKIGKPLNAYNLLILRDPYNLFASSLKKKKNWINSGRSKPGDRYDVSTETWISVWKRFAKEFIGETEHLKMRNREKICVSFDKWFLDKEYRESISKSLNLEFTDRWKNKVTGHGEGSSFDGVSFDGKGSNMNVMNRWKKYTDSVEMKKVLGDKKIRELTIEIFEDCLEYLPSI